MWITVSSFWEILQQSRFSSAHLSVLWPLPKICPLLWEVSWLQILPTLHMCQWTEKKKKESTTAEIPNPHPEQKRTLRNLNKSELFKKVPIYGFCFYFHFLIASDLSQAFMAGGGGGGGGAGGWCIALRPDERGGSHLLSLPQQSPCWLKNFSGKVSSNCSVGLAASKASPSGLIRRDLVLHFPLYLSNLGLHPSSVCAVITSLGKTVPLPNCLHSQEIVPNSQLNLISPSLLNPPRQTYTALLLPLTVLRMKWLYGTTCSYFSRSNMQNYFLGLVWVATIILNSFSLGLFKCLSAILWITSKCVQVPSALNSWINLPQNSFSLKITLEC